ncbi:MAG: peptide chain release factor 1 [Coleofasciculus sp. G1-WW12-02]|uniref:peptide chain release factor 1 n=1 Tax=Coleofasciculus sp. G1-WW12-02 TaxID=3068483 RepID=UPI0032F95894
MYRLRSLPWRSLLEVSGITVAIAIVLEIIIGLGFTQSPAIRQMLQFLYTPPLGIIISLMAAVGFGVLAVYVLERFYPHVLINSSSLWALIPCLALVLGLKSLLPLPPFLVSLSYANLVAVIVGVFWKGRPHWR